MAKHEHYQRFERWANWEVRMASGSYGAGGSSFLAALVASKGNLTARGTAGSYTDFDCDEARISEAVGKLASFDARAANVLRIEHGVITPAGLHHTDGQQSRADAAAVPSLRTYKRILRTARDWVIDEIGG